MVKTFEIKCKNVTQSQDLYYNSKEENGDYDIEDFDEDIDENEFDFEGSELDKKISECKVQPIVSFIFFNMLSKFIIKELNLKKF
jgi:hypothetical protein